MRMRKGVKESNIHEGMNILTAVKCSVSQTCKKILTNARGEANLQKEV
jgi:hypothetical protein